ncbi:MAG: DUF4129 domain-containing protein [Verrucomicrobia bacterium]|nr:DUF4129 domain-containing protein [Verrucomicrobiota bacterium]
MSRARHRQQGLGALDLVEEAFCLLRLAPAGVLAAYYAGAVPFALGLLYFWADMSGGAFARRHSADAALGVAALFLWMKYWQAVFAGHLMARLRGAPAPRWTWRRIARMVVVQTALQPTGLFALPGAALMTLPFGWACAFYHNLSVVGDGGSASVRAAWRGALRQARLWPGQNHMALAICYLFGFFVLLNLAVAMAVLPALLKTLLGVETVFSLSGAHLFNTTFIAALGGLTFLAVNPLMKAVYVVRCFYGESLTSGADLQAQLRLLRPAAGAALLGCLLALMPASLHAQTPPARSVAARPAIAGAVRPDALDRAIGETISRPEYAWRLPRQEADEDKGPVAAFLDSVVRSIGKGLKWIAHWTKTIVDWILDNQPDSRRDRRRNISGFDWVGAAQNLTVVLTLVVACALGLLFLRVWQQRRRRAEVAATAIAPPLPDLNDENVTADQLPADEWLEQARALMARGELRLALRALFLAGLASLAQQELVAIARFKSNRDYQRELDRRAHARPETVAVFAENVAAFDRVWYGAHDATPDMVDRFAANLARIKAHA